MKEPRIDDERMSALLDGTLKEPRRGELLKELAASDDDYDVFADTAAVLRELEDAEAGVVSIDQRRTEEQRGRKIYRWVRAAAVVAGLALVPVLWLLLRGRGEAYPVQLVALAGAGGVPADWAQSTMRGDPSRVTDVRAAQAGVHLVHLAVAVDAGDTAGIRLLAQQARRRFDPQSGSESPLPRIAERAGAPADSLRPLLRSATERLEERLGEDALRLGAWVEAARLAAYRRNEAFFRDDATGDALENAGERASAREAAARVRAAIPAEGTPDWDVLGPEIDALREVLVR